MSTSKIITPSLLAILLMLVVLVLHPIQDVTADDCSSVSGELINLYKTGQYDLCFQLRGDERRFYINRGLENGLEWKELQQDLLNKKITLTYVNHWTPLDPVNQMRHVAELSHQGSILYSEIIK